MIDHNIVLMRIFFFSSMLSFLFIWPSLLICHRLRLYAAVNSRSAHQRPTLVGGGMITVFATAGGLLVNYFVPSIALPSHLIIMVLCAGLLALVALFDDYSGLSTSFRFASQVLLVAISVLSMPPLPISVPAWLQCLLLIFFWVGFINIFNFMDGTDGYALQEAIVILLALILFSTGISGFCMLIIGASMGLLWVNFPKASCFMGDVGSYFYGYMLFGLMSWTWTVSLHWFIPTIIVSSLFTLDATATLLKRIACGENWLQAHRSHWYQRLFNLGYSHRAIFMVGLCLNCLLLFFAWLALGRVNALVMLLLAWSVLVAAAIVIRCLEANFIAVKNEEVL